MLTWAARAVPSNAPQYARMHSRRRRVGLLAMAASTPRQGARVQRFPSTAQTLQGPFAPATQSSMCTSATTEHPLLGLPTPPRPQHLPGCGEARERCVVCRRATCWDS
eukprot:1160429-Pelagomonas_calceolata.AAC.7